MDAPHRASTRRTWRAALLGALLLLVWPLLPALSPWTPLRITAPLTPLTWLKLRLLATDPGLCQAALRTVPFPVTPVPDEPPHHPPGGDGLCSLTDAVRVRAGAIALSPSSFLATCPLAVDWAMFLTHTVQPAALQIYGAPVLRIDHLGSYACRDIAGSAEISAHATANAIDVAAFTLPGGKVITVADWDEAGKPGQFLHQLRAGACRDFGLVLSPDFNHAHAGHFHLQATGFGFCS